MDESKRGVAAVTHIMSCDIIQQLRLLGRSASNACFRRNAGI